MAGRSVRYIRAGSYSRDETRPLLTEIDKCCDITYNSIDGKQPKRKEAGPDGWEAWRVALAACFINFIMAGLNRSSGILYVKYMHIFNVDRMQASLPITIRSSTRSLLGPVIGILGQKYGVRSITIVGGVIGSVSAFACFYAESITALTILWGVFNGIGVALSMTLAQVTVNQHFEKHRSTAAGLSYSGGCVGSLIFPTFVEFCLIQYHLGGTYIMIAGIMMHVIPAAMILIEPSWLNKTKPKIVISAPEEDNDTKDGKTQIAGADAKFSISDINVNEISTKNDCKMCSIEYSTKTGALSNGQFLLNTSELYQNDIDRDVLLDNSKLVIRLLTDGLTASSPLDVDKFASWGENPMIKEIEDLFCQIVAASQNDALVLEKDSTVFVSENGKAQHMEQKESLINSKSQIDYVNTGQNPVSCFSFYLENLFERSRSDIVQSFSEGEHETVSKILEELCKIHTILNTNEKNRLKNSHSTTSLFLDGDQFDNNLELPNTFSSHIKTAINLHTKPMFLLICLCRSIHFLTFIPLLSTIVDFSTDKGLQEEDGRYAIAALSMGDLVGRLCFGWITDRNYMSLPRFMMCFMFVYGISTICLAFTYSRESLMIVMAITSLLQGAIFVRHSVLISRYLKTHEQSIAMGCLNFLSGFLGLLLPSYIGHFRDTLGSYDGILFINGTLTAFIGLLWILEPYLVKLAKRRAMRDRLATV